MYLFSRARRLRTGDLGDAVAWALGIGDKAHQITGLDISVYQSVFGPEVGTVVFTTVVPDLAALEAAMDKLAVDQGYIEELTRGQQFAPEGADDRLLQLIAPVPDASAEPPPPPGYATVVNSSIVSGNFRRGVELGVEIAQKATEIGGAQTSFFKDVTGPYSAVAWITGYADVAALEAAQAALASNDAWLEFIDRDAKGVYAEDPAATQQLVYKRMI